MMMPSATTYGALGNDQAPPNGAMSNHCASCGEHFVYPPMVCVCEWWRDPRTPDPEGAGSRVCNDVAECVGGGCEVGV